MRISVRAVKKKFHPPTHPSLFPCRGCSPGLLILVKEQMRPVWWILEIVHWYEIHFRWSVWSNNVREYWCAGNLCMEKKALRSFRVNGYQGFIQRFKDARNSILIVIIFLLSTLIAQFNHSFENVPSIIIQNFQSCSSI